MLSGFRRSNPSIRYTSRMHASSIPHGTVHTLPADLKQALLLDAAALTAWRTITPLARNEWICWVEEAKHNDTRERRIERTHTELAEGKRRPCCWMGCIHRSDKPLSPSVRGILEKRAKSTQSRAR